MGNLTPEQKQQRDKRLDAYPGIFAQRPKKLFQGANEQFALTGTLANSLMISFMSMGSARLVNLYRLKADQQKPPPEARDPAGVGDREDHSEVLEVLC